MSIVLFDEKSECCGCTACYAKCPQHAIEMKVDEKGFLYPEIDTSKCIECQICKTVCDFKNKNVKNENRIKQEVWALKHKDSEVLKKSSSGGAFTAISDLILKNKGRVAGVILNENLLAQHLIVDNATQRNDMCGSKYMQSELRNVYCEVKTSLENNIPVLFTGTPCQVAGLKLFLGNVDISNLYTCDFICHGVVSPLLFREYIKFIEKKSHKKVANHIFRSKIHGWGHTEGNIFIDGTKDFDSFESQLHKTVFYADLGERPSCYFCKYTSIERCSDITLGDYWGIKETMPEFYSNEGVSVILVNTNKGKKIINGLSDEVELRKAQIKDVVGKQPQLEHPVHNNPEKEKFWNCLTKKGYIKAVKKYVLKTSYRRILKITKKLGIYELMRKIKHMVIKHE